MGEYIKYKNSEVKIGTVESLYYVSFEKYKKAIEAGELSRADFGDDPQIYLEPKNGFRFRFPFPDEDKLPFGDIIAPFDRTVPVKIDQSALPDFDMPTPEYEILLSQQKLINRQSDGKECLALVYRSLDGSSYRIEDDDVIKAVVGELMKHHVENNPDESQKIFYGQLASRLLDGYGLKLQELTTKKGQDNIKKPSPTKRKGRVLR